MDEISLKDIIKLLKDKDTNVTCWTADFHPFDHVPQDYLNFANDALANARGNKNKSSLNWQSKIISAWNFTRQALECRCDELLGSFGLLAHEETQRADLGAKLALLRRCGVTAPKGLQELVKIRNDLYHRYVKPRGETKDENEIEKVVSILELFIKHTQPYLETSDPYPWGAIVLACISKYAPFRTEAQRAEIPLTQTSLNEFPNIDLPVFPPTIEEYYCAIDLVDTEKLNKEGVKDLKGSRLRVVRTKPPGGQAVSMSLAAQKQEEVVEFMKLLSDSGRQFGESGICGDLAEVYKEIEGTVISKIGRGGKD